MKFRHKPTIIEAIQYIGDNKREVREFAGGNVTTNTCYDHLTLWMSTGNQTINVGDWVIKQLDGQCYPCKDEVFKTNYEEVTEPDNDDTESDKKRFFHPSRG